MNEYKGMNFWDWCKLNPDDERKICYDKTPFGEFTSENMVGFEVIEKIRKCFIKSIELIENEWHVHLVKNKSYANGGMTNA